MGSGAGTDGVSNSMSVNVGAAVNSALGVVGMSKSKSVGNGNASVASTVSVNGTGTGCGVGVVMCDRSKADA